MKKVLNLLVLVSFLAGITALNSCKKDPDVATLTTTAASSITTTSASSGGNITDDGGADVTARGVCWGTASNPTITGSKTSDGIGVGNFTSAISGLTPNTLYYVRAYATNSAGTAYGNEVSFTTNPVTGATVTTTAVTAITTTTATSGGNVTADGGGSITARGVCWATTANPDLTNSKTTDGTGTGTFASNLTGLTPGTLYHVRAYATNSSGTTYGTDVTFTTAAVVPTVTTAAITVFAQTTATAGGNVTANGGADVTARGVCYGTAAAPDLTNAFLHTTDGAGNGAFTSSLTGLTPGTLYHVRAYATNSAGTAYGADVTFTTSAVTLPVIATAAVTSVTNNSASSGGNVTSAGGGTITARGVCWGTSPNPVATGSHTTETGTTGSFTSSITGLLEGTRYYVRAYATNSAGTAYGPEVVTFLTRMSDQQGNIYNTIEIGDQIWMAENLRATVFSDDTPIQNVTAGAAWALLAEPAYALYGNLEANGPLYGALYNWYAASSLAGLCPTGWHVPSDDEFKALELEIGMEQAQVDLASAWRGTTEGDELKSTVGWTAGAGTNTSGFSAIPAGYRYYEDGGFVGLGTVAYFWTTTQDGMDRAYMRQLDSTHATVQRANADMNAGKSVRCIKNSN